jgi:2-dehydropantoate 2-reductase
MRERSYAIIGAGAVGGFYGGRLQRAGLDVHFLLHSDYEHVCAHGLFIESKDGDFALPSVQVYRDAQAMPRCDVVAVTLKATQNHILPDILPHVLKDDGVVVLMQNGLGVEDDVARIVGPLRVMAGLCFLCSNKVGPGRIQHLDYGTVCFADYAADGAPRGVTERMRQIAADFQRAGITVELDEDLLTARWKKLVWNIPFNGLSVVLNATTTEMMADPDARALAEALMREVVADAAACGRQIGKEFVQKMLAYTAKMIPYRTSMKIDYDERRPMEVEAIYGNPLRAAKRAGADSPRLEALYRQLKFMDARNAGLARA